MMVAYIETLPNLSFWAVLQVCKVHIFRIEEKCDIYTLTGRMKIPFFDN